jgi:2-C-methyl-D-erythritol 4-phosphate cytidylyltransferase
MKKFAVIVAGGVGSRMNQSMPKQFLLLLNKPIIYYTIQTFLKAYNDITIVIVIHKDYIRELEEIVKEFKHKIIITEGGATRFHSVKNGLQFVQENSIVFVHDAVRCLLSVSLIHTCFNHALTHGSAVPAVVSTDSVRLQNENNNTALNRKDVKIIQTPQTFKSNILLDSFNVEFDEKFTDEATVVEFAGNKIELVEGEYENIKITRPSDLILAEYFLKLNHTTF